METDCTRDELPDNGGVITPLPTGTRLLHIGPHKTGTTAIQSALFAAKDDLARHGVEWPATTRHQMEAVLAACARSGMMGDTEPTERHWERLLERVRATGRRTSVIDSEFFADASPTPVSGAGTGTTGAARTAHGSSAARSGRGESLGHPRRDRNAAES